MPKTLGDARHRVLIDFIIEKRLEAGMKQTELAKCLGEHQSFVARLESGQRRVDVIELIKFGEIHSFDPLLTMRELMQIGPSE